MTQTVGDILQSDFQSDMFQGSYKLIKNLGRGTWEIEILPDDEATLGRILDHYAYAEAHGFKTTPIWDKTWNECDTDAGERPQRIGYLTYEQELEKELESRAHWFGTRRQIRFVSAAKFAEAF